MRARWLAASGFAAATLAGAAPAALDAQRPVPNRRPVPAARDTARPLPPIPIPPDSLPGDTTSRERGQLVEWLEADSVMSALLERTGYTATRYQGNRVTFGAASSVFRLEGDAAIARDQTILVADTIVYNDSTKIVRATGPPGDTIILRDPSQGSADLVALGRLVYDIENRRGQGSRVSTTVESGESWYVWGEHTAVRGDTSGRGETISYARDGTITSCDLAEPHYHFQAGELKLVTKRIMVARPAVLYIADIPVLWLPFIFQDMRTGRRSGVIPPRLGISDIVRTTPGYRRHIDNAGYYFAINDYMDAEVSLDWRSSVKATEGDPGWLRYNGEWRYRWLDRFITGRLAASHTSFDGGRRNTALSLSHQQEFSQRSRLSANMNYVTSTVLQRQESFNVARQLATIHSQLNYQQTIGPASFSIGGARKQYPGRDQVDQDFPNFTITSKPINAGRWLVWSPQLSVNNTQSFDIDATGTEFPFRYFNRSDGRLDSAAVKRDTRQSSASFQTPIRILDFNWRNSFSVTDVEHDFPESRTIVDPTDPTQQSTRVFARTYLTSIKWETGIDLPRIAQGALNLVPSVQIVDVDPRGFWVRSERTGGKYVSQSKRLQYALSASPTLFGFFPGIGPISRIRHSLTPSISYSFAPAGRVSDEYLAALGGTRAGYLGAFRQNQVSLSLSQNFEAKLGGQNGADTAGAPADKIKLLSLNFSPLSYDFERARQTGKTGFTTPNFTYSARSDLLPSLDVTVGYSLFQGNPLNDSATFKPFRETISASFSLGRGRNPFAVLTRVFGRAVPPDSGTIPGAPQAGEGLPSDLRAPAIAGASASRNPIGIREGQGWEVSLSYAASRRRPPVGGTIREFDPLAFCQTVDPISRPLCEQQRLAIADTLASTTEGGFYVRTPPTSTVRGNFTFDLTPNWAVQWGTGYDFQRSDFSDHQVTLQRKLHDWRAIFAFTQAPNGNFAFNFFIALNAEPDLKFDYDRRTYRPDIR